MALPIRTALQKRGFDPREKRDERGRWSKTSGISEAIDAMLAPEEKLLRRRQRTVDKRERELDLAEKRHQEVEGPARSVPKAAELKWLQEESARRGQQLPQHTKDLIRAHKNLAAAFDRLDEAKRPARPIPPPKSEREPRRPYTYVKPEGLPGTHAHVATRELENEFDKIGFHPTGIRPPTVENKPKLSRTYRGLYHGDKEHIQFKEESPQGAHLYVLSHEYGHHIDNAMGVHGEYGSGVKTGEISRIVDRLLETATMKELGVSSMIKDKRKKYLFKRREIWARAFAQWLSTKTGNLATRGQYLDNAYFNGQWPDREFAPVADMMDKYFKDLEWLT